MILVFLFDAHETLNTNEYIVGAVLAFVILGYLLYSLVKPEKF